MSQTLRPDPDVRIRVVIYEEGHLVVRHSSRPPAVGACFWAIPQASNHPMAPRTGSAFPKALTRGVTALPSEPVPDADASR